QGSRTGRCGWITSFLRSTHHASWGVVRVCARFVPECGAPGGSLGGTLSRRTRGDVGGAAEGRRAGGGGGGRGERVGGGGRGVGARGRRPGGVGSGRSTLLGV